MEEICLYIGLLGAFAELVDCFRVACGSYALKLRIACKKLKDLCPLLYALGAWKSYDCKRHAVPTVVQTINDLLRKVGNRELARRELKNLRHGVTSSLLSVQRHLSLGWIGVWDVLHKNNMETNNLMGLWKDFYSFLLQLQQFFLKFEKMLMLWGNILYLLLLSSSFSEFPGRLRPPCTTMPWTIWPALVVLWGVCWMFYEPLNLDWEPGLFDENSSAQILGLDPTFPDFNCHAPGWGASHSDLLDFEQQLQQSMPQPIINFRIPTTIESIPNPSTVRAPDTTSLPVSTNGISSTIVLPTSATMFSATQETAEARRVEAEEPSVLESPYILSPVHEQPPDGARSVITDGQQTRPSRNSRHSQIEKYQCPYSECSRSQQGSGFCRKDHLDQHLRGVHKQSSVARVRAKSAVASSSSNPTATSQIEQRLSQPKKRKRGEDGGSETPSVEEAVDELAEELANERRLRISAEQENQRLRQMLEKRDERLEKYEERLDRMMTLFGEGQDTI